MLAFLPGDRYTTTADSASTTTTSTTITDNESIINDDDNNNNNKEPLFFCTELCREAFGINYPSKRRQQSLLMVRNNK